MRPPGRGPRTRALTGTPRPQDGKSLYSTLREFVENALDAAESMGQLPTVEVTM